MKKLVKVIYTVFVSITLFCIFTMNNVNTYAKVNSPFTTNYETIKSTIQSQKCYASLNMNYHVDYTIEGSTTKLFQKKQFEFIIFQYGVSFADKYFSDVTDEVSMYLVKNDVGTRTQEVYPNSFAIYSSYYEIKNGNGEELVIKVPDDRVITSISFTYRKDEHKSELDFNCNAKEYVFNQVSYTSQYSFNISDECTEIRLKNTSAYHIDLDNIELNTCQVTRTITNFSFIKNNETNKNLTSLQFVGRISPELYQNIGTEFGASNVSFGMFYGNQGNLESSEINSVVASLTVGTPITSSGIKLINEIGYSDLKGYDETGHIIVNENPISYQWGVSLNGVGYSNRVILISANPYVKIKNNDVDNTYTIILLTKSVYSLQTICDYYYAQNAGTVIDRLVFKYLGTSNN